MNSSRNASARSGWPSPSERTQARLFEATGSNGRDSSRAIELGLVLETSLEMAKHRRHHQDVVIVGIAFQGRFEDGFDLGEV